MSFAPPPGLQNLAGSGTSGARGGDDILAGALREQTQAILALAGRRRKGPPEGLAVLLADGQDEEEEEDVKMPGARGAAAMTYLAEQLEAKPEVFTTAVVKSLLKSAANQPGASENPRASARAYVMHEIPFGAYNTLGYLAWGVAGAWDHLQAGRVQAAQAALSLLLVAMEQVALDDCRWQLGWLLTHQPEPPWASMTRRPDGAALKPFAKLADARWVAAAMAYIKDVDRLQQARRPKRGDVADDRPPPKAPPKAKGQGGGGWGGLAAEAAK